MAEALQTRLHEQCKTDLWKGFFSNSAQPHLKPRGRKGSSPRGNVLFELGLFMGTLGRERVFPILSDAALHTAGDRLLIPSDFAGVTVTNYRSSDLNKGNLEACIEAINDASITLSREVQRKKRFRVPSRLTTRAAGSISAYLEHRVPGDEEFLVSTTDDKNQAFEKFKEECHMAWDKSGTYHTVRKALNDQPFGMCVSAAGLIGDGPVKKQSIWTAV